MFRRWDVSVTPIRLSFEGVKVMVGVGVMVRVRKQTSWNWYFGNVLNPDLANREYVFL